MRAVILLCVLPLLCSAKAPVEHHSEGRHPVPEAPKPGVQPAPKKEAPKNHPKEEVPKSNIQVLKKLRVPAKFGSHDVTVCTHDHAVNLAVIVLFAEKTKVAETLCQNEHVVTVISSTRAEDEATVILKALPDVIHQYGGSAKRLTVMSEGHAGEVLWNLLQDPSAHDLFHNVIFYDVVPGLYTVATNLKSFPAKKKVIFGLAHDEAADIANDKVITHAADFLAQGDERLLKTLQYFYGKRPVGTVVQDVTLFRTVKAGLEQITDNGGDLFFYEGGKQQDKLMEALITFALTGTPGFLTTETSWPRFEPSTRMYLDLTGDEAVFKEGWRKKNNMLWDMINPTLPELH